MRSIVINMVLQGQDKWRKHPLIFEAWRKPFPMLGTAIVVFTAFCIGEYAYKSAQNSRPQLAVYRYTANPNGGAPILQKRVPKTHDHHGHGHHAAHEHSSHRVGEAPEFHADGEEMTPEEKLRKFYDYEHRIVKEHEHLTLDFHINESQKE